MPCPQSAVNNFQTRPGKKGRTLSDPALRFQPYFKKYTYLLCLPVCRNVVCKLVPAFLAAQVCLHLGAHFFPVVSGIFRISGNQVAFICIALYGTSHGIGYFHGDIGECGNKAALVYKEILSFFIIYKLVQEIFCCLLLCFAVVLGINHAVLACAAGQLVNCTVGAVRLCYGHNSVFASFYRKV